MALELLPLLTLADERRPSHSCPLNQVVGIRSNLWPGAVSVFAGPNTGSLYVGYGFSTSPYKPPAPPAPTAEFAAFELKESTELPPPPPEPEAVPVEGEGEAAEEEES